jgi:hypothetical protein
MIKKITPYVLAMLILVIPAISYAALIPCGDPGQPACDLSSAISLINNILRFLIFTLAAPACALLVMYAGWLYMTSGENAGNRKTANEILTNAVLGFVLLLAAWLVIQLVLVAFGVDQSFSPYFDFS